MDKKTCVYPSCVEEPTRDVHGGTSGEIKWCSNHFGLFPHNCEYPGCKARPVYDDEPMCFEHSPDSGSSVRGYSASRKAFDVVT